MISCFLQKGCYFTVVLLFNPHTNYEHSIETSYTADELKCQIKP